MVYNKSGFDKVSLEDSLMQRAIVFYVLDGFNAQWSLKGITGPIESLETAERILREWGYSKQEGYELGDVHNAWLRIGTHTRNVPSCQPQYGITKAEILEIKPC